MDRYEAARFLGVSLRTLDRLVAGGRLTKGREFRKTRPIVVFRQEEVIALKEELSRPDTNTTGRRGITPTKDSIAFRIDPYYLERLVAGGKVVGLSPGEYARSLVVRALEQEQTQRIDHELRRLRESLAAVFYALLTTSLGSSPTEARRIVDEAILKA